MKMLGDLDEATFLKLHWQKKPLLIRSAFPAFDAFVDRDRLLALAGRDDAPSRLVLHSDGEYEVHEGPFAFDLEEMPAADWTLLVQGVEGLVDDAAWDLLRKFAFAPRARVDDLMVSYARTGGGVGAHYDQYDVFLLQAAGRRRWRISEQEDLELDESQPVKLLQDFRPSQEFVLEPGDMLYLPPYVAHEGVALDDDCLTYSIGFLAPSWDALQQEFLAYLSMREVPEGVYVDPWLEPSMTPARVPTEMTSAAVALLERLRWDREEVEVFLGRLLTGPKPHVHFDDARNDEGAGKVARLHPAARMLTAPGLVFLNGEAFALDDDGFDEFALCREIQLTGLTKAQLALIDEWFALGWLRLR